MTAITWEREDAHNQRAHIDGKPLKIVVRSYGEATGTTLWEVVDTRRTPWVVMYPAISTEKSAKKLAEATIARARAK